jgi:hypothetical protein
MKFPAQRGTVITIRGKGSKVRNYYLKSLKIVKTSPDSHERRDLPKDSRVMITNMDPRADFKYQRTQLEGDQIEI